jgi:hypothetical protein
MSYIHHEVLIAFIPPDDLLKLKRIAQAFTRLGDNHYVVHHNVSLTKSCPICRRDNGEFDI